MGYRRTKFDPLAGDTSTQPIAKPFDRWQWFGVFAQIVAVGLYLLWFADRLALQETGANSIAVALAFSLLLGGNLLLRRDPELALGELGDRKWQLIIVLFGFAILPFSLD